MTLSATLGHSRLSCRTQQLVKTTSSIGGLREWATRDFRVQVSHWASKVPDQSTNDSILGLYLSLDRQFRCAVSHRPIEPCWRECASSIQYKRSEEASKRLTTSTRSSHSHLNMFPSLKLITLLLVLLPFASANTDTVQQSGLEKRKNCDSELCVTFYADGGCTSGRTIGSYKPDCTGACSRYDSFASIKVSGSTIWVCGERPSYP